MVSKIDFDFTTNEAGAQLTSAIETPGALRDANNTVLQHNRLFSAGQEAIRRAVAVQDRILGQSSFRYIGVGMRLYTASYLFANPEGAKGRAFAKGVGAAVATESGMSIMNTAQSPPAFDGLKTSSLEVMKADVPRLYDSLAQVVDGLVSKEEQPELRFTELMTGAALMRHVHTLGARAVWWRFSKKDL